MTTKRSRFGAVLVVTLIGLAACGGSDGGSSESDVPVLTGSITRVSGAPCSDLETARDEDFMVGEKALTARDESGTIVGTVDTEPAELERRDNGGCEMTSAFEIELKPSDFYTFELEGPSEATEPISAEDIESADYQCDMNVELPEFTDEADQLVVDC